MRSRNRFVTTAKPMKKPVLITGGAGYIGSHVSLELLEAGYPIVVLDNLSRGGGAIIADGAAFIENDAQCRETTIKAMREHKIGTVIHLAASTSITESAEQPEHYERNNEQASAKLIETCIEAGVERFVFASSSAVYGVPEANPVAETARTNPTSPYGRSKLATEQRLRQARAEHSMSYIVLRVFNVAGADPKGRAGPMPTNRTNLFAAVCEAVNGERGHIVIEGTDYETGDGTCVRDYVHVSDVARAYLAGLKHLEAGKDSTIVNCGRNVGVSVRKLLSRVRESGHDIKSRNGPRRMGDPPELVADTEKIRQLLGWQPQINNIDAMIRTALAWGKTKDVERVNSARFRAPTQAPRKREDTPQAS